MVIPVVKNSVRGTKLEIFLLNRSSRRKIGMASNPLFIIPNELGYGYLRFEGNGKIPLGR